MQTEPLRATAARLYWQAMAERLTTPGRAPASRRLGQQQRHQFRVQAMAAAMGDEMSCQVVARQRQVTDQVQGLVTHAFVRKPQRIVDRPRVVEHQQIPARDPCSQSLAAQPSRFFFQDKGPRRRLVRGGTIRGVTASVSDCRWIGPVGP